MRAVILLHTMKKTDRQQRRRQGEMWLYEAVAAFGHTHVTREDCPLERAEKGKPYFPARPDIYFSISHSQDLWACVVADQPVGLDLQYHKEGRLDNIAPRFFHPTEAAWLDRLRERNSQDPAGEGTDHETSAVWRREFFDIWAAKESYVKWTGQGIDREFGHFSVVDETGLLTEMSTPEQKVFFRRVMIAEDYSLCLCSGEAWEQVEIVRAD